MNKLFYIMISTGCTHNLNNTNAQMLGLRCLVLLDTTTLRKEQIG